MGTASDRQARVDAEKVRRDAEEGGAYSNGPFFDKDGNPVVPMPKDPTWVYPAVAPVVDAQVEAEKKRTKEANEMDHDDFNKFMR